MNPATNQLIGYCHREGGFFHAYLRNFPLPGEYRDQPSTLLGSISDGVTQTQFEDWHKEICQKIEQRTGQAVTHDFGGYYQL